MKFTNKLNIIFLILSFIATSAFANKKEMVVFNEDKLAVSVTSDQPQFVLKLKSNPSTGYSWFLKEYDKNIIQAVKHRFEAAANKHLVGAPGSEYWLFRAKPDAFIVPQTSEIVLIYKRPWDSEEQAKELHFNVYLTGKI